MGTQKFSSWSALKTHFDKGLLLESVHRIMLCFGDSLWVLARSCLVFLLEFITKFVLSSGKEDQSDLDSSTDVDPDGFCKTQSFQYFFGFQFQTSEEEEDRGTRTSQTGDSISMETYPIHSARKYQAFSGKDFFCFLAQPEAVDFTVKELFANAGDSQVASSKDFVDLNPEIKGSEFQLDSISDSSSEASVAKDSREINLQTEAVDLEEAGDTIQSLSDEHLSEKQEQAVPIEEHGCSEIHELAGKEHNLLGDINDSGEASSHSEDHRFFPFNSEPKLTISCERASISRAPSPVLAEADDLDFLEKVPDFVGINRDDVKIYESDAVEINENNLEYQEEIRDLDGIGGEYEKINDSEEETRNREKTEDIDDEDYIELEPNRELSIPSDKATCHGEDDLAQIDHESHERKSMYNFEDCEESSSQKKNPFPRLDCDEDEDGIEDILMEHRELVEQMKMEAKNARNGGLPTILEECETPKMADDLKPLRFEERLEYKDHVEEIQKVYKSYAEKMKKLDILNYQTVHAISFLQMKDPSHQFPGLKTSVSAIKSLLFPSLWPCKLRRIYADPTVKSNAELYRNLETVYVGQACLSWEILCWQYEKAKELLLNDVEGLRSYDQVAYEFQQFQVLVQRFVENEVFQGPRVQNYAKNRCALRPFLQVPAIKDDCLKDKREIRGEYRVSVAMLTDILEESMCVFWDFLRADKGEGSPILKGLHGPRVDQSGLLTELKSTLQKKDRRLKDIVRSGNCIVKKFQKQREGRMNCTQLLAQVELKLVARVLSMSRLTTDQLVWCQKKLNKVKFVNRKIHLEEPSFLLFPL